MIYCNAKHFVAEYAEGAVVIGIDDSFSQASPALFRSLRIFHSPT